MFILALFLLILSHDLFAGIDGYRLQRFQINADGKYFKTTDNFNSDSNKVNLPGENFMELGELDLGLRFDPSENFSTKVEFQIRRTVSDDPLFTRTNTSLAYINFLGDVQLLLEPFELIIQGETLIPTYTFKYNTEKSLISDGAFAGGARVFIKKSLGFLYAYAEVGVLFRGDGLSTLLPWSVHFKRNAGFLFDIGLSGFSSLSEDSDPILRRQIIDRVNAGSFLFYSPQPSQLNFELRLGYGFDDVRMYVGSEIPLYGTRSASGFGVLAGLTMQFGGQDDSTIDRELKEESFLLESDTKEEEEKYFAPQKQKPREKKDDLKIKIKKKKRK